MRLRAPRYRSPSPLLASERATTHEIILSRACRASCRRRDDALHVLADLRGRRRRCSASPITTARSPSTASSHEPESGLDASAAVAHAGLQVGGLEVTGAFASEKITESGSRGRALRQCARRGVAGELGGSGRAPPDARRLDRRGAAGGAARSPRRSAALRHALDQERGRIFRATCDADLGDARCGDRSRERGLDGERDGDGDGWVCADHRARCPATRPTGFFDQGFVTFTSGANDGRKSEVLRHVRDDGRRPSRAVAADGRGDRGGRRVHGLGRLRQALCDVPRPLRQRR